MKTFSRIAQQFPMAAIWAAAIIPTLAIAQPNPGYVTNAVVSDVPGVARRADARVVNPWGVAFDGTRLFVAENGTGLITVHTPDGLPTRTSIRVPAPANSTNAFGTPTGIAINRSSGFFVTRTNGARRARSAVLFATEDGTIGGWNSATSGTNAVIVIDNSGTGAVYKGIALGTGTNGTFLYAANFTAGTIERYDTNFGLMQSFTDPTLSGAGFAPFGIKVIQRTLFVTYAVPAAGGRDDQPGQGNGAIALFNLEGTPLRVFADGGPLNSPWGLALAPTHYGKFSGNLLVGNFGDGRILGYNLITGEFLGALQSRAGDDIVIPGLWSLDFEREFADLRFDFEAPRLIFTAGINEEADGLLGTIRAINPFRTPAR